MLQTQGGRGFDLAPPFGNGTTRSQQLLCSDMLQTLIDRAFAEVTTRQQCEATPSVDAVDSVVQQRTGKRQEETLYCATIIYIQLYLQVYVYVYRILYVDTPALLVVIVIGSVLNDYIVNTVSLTLYQRCPGEYNQVGSLRYMYYLLLLYD